MAKDPQISPRITLRLPENDLNKLRLIAETQGLSLSEVIRQMVDANSADMYKKVRRKAKRSALNEQVVRDLARAGNNVNRVATALVHLGINRQRPSSTRIVAELVTIRSLLEDIRKHLR